MRDKILYMYVFYIKVKRFRPGRKYFFDNIIISHLESISYRLAIDELLVPVAAEVGNHGFVDAVGPCSNIEAAAPVQVGEDGADLVKVVVVHEVVVTEMETLQNRIRLVSPDGVCNQAIVAVWLGLPQHFSVGNAVVTAMEEKGFSTSVRVYVDHLPCLLEVLLHGVESGLVQYL